MVIRDADRIGQEGSVPGSGSPPGPAGTSGSGAQANPYPVYGAGAGLGVGSASEEASARGKCCGGALGSSPAGSSQAAPLLTGSALEPEPSRTDFLGDPLAPAPPALPPLPSVPSGIPPRPPDPNGPGRFARSMFAPPPDCERAPCEGFVRAHEWMVQFVRTGAAWPALPRRRPEED